MPTAVKARQNIVRHGRKRRPQVASLSLEDARYYIVAAVKQQLDTLELPRGAQVWRLCYWAALFFERCHYEDGAPLQDPHEFLYIDRTAWAREHNYSRSVLDNDWRELVRHGFFHAERAGQCLNSHPGERFPSLVANAELVAKGKQLWNHIQDKLEHQARRKNAAGREQQPQPAPQIITQEAGSFQGVCEDTNKVLSVFMCEALADQDFDTYDSLTDWTKLVARLGVSRDMESLHALIQQALTLLQGQNPKRADMRAQLHLFVSKLYQKADSLQLVISFKENSDGN